MKTKTVIYLFAGFLCLGLFWAGIGCDLPGGTGTLVMNLTDAPDVSARISLKKDAAEEETYEEVFITFTEISVHKADADNESDAGDDDIDDDNETDDNATDSGAAWIIISSEEQGFDLMQLQSGCQGR